MSPEDLTRILAERMTKDEIDDTIRASEDLIASSRNNAHFIEWLRELVERLRQVTWGSGL